MKGDYRIGDLARATDMAVETVRYYERIGLLPEPPRTTGNYRLYGDGHLHRLRFIRRARTLGFHLDVIRDLLGMVDRPDQPCASIDQLARAQMAEVDAKIADLTRLRAELAHVANQCHGGTVRECRIVEALSGGEGESLPAAASTGA